jgi:hypothetical protein
VSAALDLFWSRAGGEEGRRPYAYNDATGKTVTCKPGGNLSIGVGINLETGLDSEEMEWLFRHRAGLNETTLLGFPWYAAADPVRQSVALDIAYNAGLHGLLGFPHMIAAYADQDWPAAAKQCAVEDPKLDQSRYAPLRALILSGGTTTTGAAPP